MTRHNLRKEITQQQLVRQAHLKNTHIREYNIPKHTQIRQKSHI